MINSAYSNNTLTNTELNEKDAFEIYLISNLHRIILTQTVLLNSADKIKSFLIYFTLNLFTAEYIKPCPKNHPNINQCLRGTFEHLRPYLVTGFKDISVPSLDPLAIDKLVIENGRRPYRIKALFSNVTAYGGSNYSIGAIK